MNKIGDKQENIKPSSNLMDKKDEYKILLLALKRNSERHCLKMR